MAVDEKVEKTTETEKPVEKTDDKKPTLDEALAELEKVRAALKNTNHESADRRKRLEALEAKEKEAELAKLSEVERLKAERAADATSLATAQAELRAERIARHVELAALAMDFHDPEDAMTPAVLDAIEFDDKGAVKPASVTTALKALAERKPHLIARPDPDLKLKPNGTPAASRTAPPRPTITPEVPRRSLVR